MQLYQFERIYSQMEKEFGKMRKGEEEVYSMLLLPLEGNAEKLLQTSGYVSIKNQGFHRYMGKEIRGRWIL